MSLTSRASINRARPPNRPARGGEFNVADELDHVRGPRVLDGGPGEVCDARLPEVLCLADVNDAPLGVLHQIDAGRRRKAFDFFRPAGAFEFAGDFSGVASGSSNNELHPNESSGEALGADWHQASFSFFSSCRPACQTGTSRASAAAARLDAEHGCPEEQEDDADRRNDQISASDMARSSAMVR